MFVRKKLIRASRAVIPLAACAACLLAPVSAGETSAPFKLVTIDDQPPERPYYKMVGDVDGDGQLDILVAGARDQLVWYSYPQWEKRTIAKEGWGGVNGEVADIDGDGDQDVVMCSVVWFRNPSSPDTPWEMTRIADQEAHDIEVGDLDGDGRPDVVARHQAAFGARSPDGTPVFVYYQVAANSWKKLKIPCPHGEGLELGDLDRDGDQDILVGSLWYENTGGGPNAEWPVHQYTASWSEPDAKVEMADINGDGRPDIVLTPSELKGEYGTVAWYEQPADPRAGGWKEHVIVPRIECVIHSLAVGDIDGDGDPDVAIAEMHQGADPDEVSVHYNSRNGTTWNKQVLSQNGSHDIVLADIGGDGDLDIVGANHAGKAPIEFWENGLK